MTSPQPERGAMTPIYASGRPLSITPGSRVKTPLSDDAIWKRLKDAGFDEDSIKNRDKAALIAYIAKLEAEIFDLHHHMGLLILEKNVLTSKNGQIKTSVDAIEVIHRRDQAANVSALAEARKREESLKKALGIEKECIASIEKALHEMRAECAETKVLSDNKLAEARTMVEDAQKKFIEAEAKMHMTESLHAEANRYHRAAERKLQEVEAREDDLTRRITAFKADCDAKEKDMRLERQSLSDRQKVLQQEQERLLDGQALLSQREDYIFNKSRELSQLEKELEASKANIEEQRRALNEEKSNVELSVASVSKREEVVFEREVLLGKKEQDLLILQEKVASKESEEIKNTVADHESVLRTIKSKFEAELERKRKLVEDELMAKRRAWELREIDLNHREDLLLEREHDLVVQSKTLVEKERDVAEKLNHLQERERSLNDSQKDVELKNLLLEGEKEEIVKMKLNLQESLDSLEDKKKQVDSAKEKLEFKKSETDELSVLEMKLKEEVDVVRAQKFELVAEADRLRVEKAKFEVEWEVLDEKREEIRKEAERLADERQALSKFLKDERDSLRLEKNLMRNQHKNDLELLNREQEEFMNKMAQERSECFSKLQQEHAEFLLGVEMQKRELESCIEKRREEVESYLKEREKTLEQERANDLQYINSLKESASKELEHVAFELKRLEAERTEINLDRERRDQEWAELNKSIEELEIQRQKLKEQRESLHTERDEIRAEIERLKTLENLKVALDYDAVSKMQQANLESWKRLSAKRYLKQQSSLRDAKLDQHDMVLVSSNGDGLNSPAIGKPNGASTPGIAHLSWIRRCKEMIFKSSPEKSPPKHENGSPLSDNEEAHLTSAGKLDYSNAYVGKKYKGQHIFSEMQPIRYALGEPKVILEVPPECKVSKGTHDFESEIKEDASGTPTSSSTGRGLQAGRKRRVNNLASNDHIDPQPEQGQNNKKRRQQQDEAINPAGEAFLDRNTGEDQSVMESSNTAQGDAQELTDLVVDKIIKVSEATCEKKDIETIQETIHYLLNPTGESEHGGGTNVNKNSVDDRDSVSPSGHEVLATLQEVLQGYGGQEHSQPLEPDVVERNGLKVKDGNAESED
ncbi:protein CROWDED NUCLEI 4-like isoform X2 [Tripterygium wilfordii]|uniref:protein CROWDED NUCLEI 4-like isoform X2 n=1 Tax=Tripterygium wilfordii TaxID=458696 RepID=UPI0018F85C28|nr:protein CROWDED NUCLEI 4-like isoform X2 [Tripterygium wilfordii]